MSFTHGIDPPVHEDDQEPQRRLSDTAATVQMTPAATDEARPTRTR